MIFVSTMMNLLLKMDELDLLIDSDRDLDVTELLRRLDEFRRQVCINR